MQPRDFGDWHEMACGLLFSFGRTVPLTSIDGIALFMGRRSLCVSSKVFPTVVPDTIVMRVFRCQNFLEKIPVAFLLLFGKIYLTID
jgi:hypothetical protein